MALTAGGDSVLRLVVVGISYKEAEVISRARWFELILRTIEY